MLYMNLYEKVAESKGYDNVNQLARAMGKPASYLYRYAGKPIRSLPFEALMELKDFSGLSHKAWDTLIREEIGAYREFKKK